tara:strand:+ start:584 stop:772 length:189 start_codon:yes stop_codon:yes gene_type:complete
MRSVSAAALFLVTVFSSVFFALYVASKTILNATIRIVVPGELANRKKKRKTQRFALWWAPEN